jgi:hypothetical protein
MTCLHILCIHTFHCVTLQHFTLDTYIIWYVMLWYDIKQCNQANHYAKQHDYPKGPSLIWCAFFFAGVGQQNGSTPTKNETWGCKQHNIGNKLSKKKTPTNFGINGSPAPNTGVRIRQSPWFIVTFHHWHGHELGKLGFIPPRLPLFLQLLKSSIPWCYPWIPW